MPMRISTPSIRPKPGIDPLLPTFRVSSIRSGSSRLKAMPNLLNFRPYRTSTRTSPSRAHWVTAARSKARRLIVPHAEYTPILLNCACASSIVLLAATSSWPDGL